ncbi:hypothetical protein ACWDSD_30235 [Streptomyces spiralis]
MEDRTGPDWREDAWYLAVEITGPGRPADADEQPVAPVALAE